MHGRDEKCTKILAGKPERDRAHFRDPGMDGCKY